MDFFIEFYVDDYYDWFVLNKVFGFMQFGFLCINQLIKVFVYCV